MNPLKLALELFSRKGESNDPSSETWDRVSREIKGSILSLLALFLVVSLMSYLPVDSFNIFQGRLDRINNLGGIVGALTAEWFLGTTGFAGYTIIIVMTWLAFTAFRGIALREKFFKLMGIMVAVCLGAMALHLFFADEFPEASLMQGGMVGRLAGDFLRAYFNTTGAILLVGGAFVFTAILTAGFSILNLVGRLIPAAQQDSEDASDSSEKRSRETKEISQPATATTPNTSRALSNSTNSEETEKPKRRRRKAAAKTVDGDDVTEAGLDENESEGEPVPTGEPGKFEFQNLIPVPGNFSLPSLRLLKSPSGGPRRMSRGEAKQNAQKLCEHLLSFQITGEVVAVSEGPVLTTYEFKPSAGMKLSKIAGLQDDLGIVMGTRELRIVAPIPGKTVVGIEVPRPQAEVIALKDILAEDSFSDKKLKIPFALGKATDGTPLVADVTALPHLLVAGSTGSGKSVFVNSLIMSFLFRMTPQQLRLILVDPKMLELNVFDGLPHLITNVITDNKVAFTALNWAVMEMDRRYALMAKTGSKNIESYNSKMKSADAKLPFIVIVVDELADLMMSGGEEVEIAITRLAQKARAAGIHLIIATQRPSTDVITGLIKANIPSRISFKVPSGIDSRTVLDTSGAEELIGRGDSLMIQAAIPLRRIHGCFVTEEELTRVVKNVKNGKDYSKYYIDFGGIPTKPD